MSEAKHTLTDVTVEENSLVDRPANQRTFLVRKRSAADGDGYLNPILKEDLEQEKAAKAEAVTNPESEKDMKKNDATATAAAEFANLVEAAVKSGSSPSPTTVVVVTSAPAVVKTETTPAVEAPKTETPAATVETEKATEVVAETPKAPVVETAKTDKPVEEKAVKTDKTAEEKTAKSEDEDKEKVLIQPALKGALEAGLRSIGELADKALKTLGQAQGDVGGISWTPWDIRCLVQQIDDLADRMLDDYEGGFGGSGWVADAILAGGAADGVSKAGAAMASARLKRFSSAHGDMGSAFKGLKKAYDAMGDLLKEVSSKDEKTEKADETAPATAPVVVVPDAVTPPAPVVKAEKDMSEVADLRKELTELRKALAAQAAVIEKARIPQSSNVIPVEKSDRGNDTMNRDIAWPADMGASNRSRPGW